MRSICCILLLIALFIISLNQAFSEDLNFRLLGSSDLTNAPILPKTPTDRKISLTKEYWVCANTANNPVRIKCLSLGTSETEGPKAELEISFRFQNQVHEYGLRHGILLNDCRKRQSDIQKLLAAKKNQPFCVKGMLAANTTGRLNSKFEWVFDEIRSSSDRHTWF